MSPRKASFSRNFIDKDTVPQRERDLPSNLLRNKQYSPHTYFPSRDATIEDIAEWHTQGRAWSPYQFDQSYRKKEMFIAGDFIGLDLDKLEPDDFERILANAEVMSKTALMAPTASDGIDGLRSARMVFQLERTITDPEEMQQAIKAVAHWVAKSTGSPMDTAANEYGRFFYGAQGKTPTYLDPNAIIPPAVLGRMIEEYDADQSTARQQRDAALEARRGPRTGRTLTPSTDRAARYVEAAMSGIEDDIAALPQGNRHSGTVPLALRAFSFSAGGYVSEADAEGTVLRGASRNGLLAESEREVRDVIEWARQKADSIEIPEREYRQDRPRGTVDLSQAPTGDSAPVNDTQEPISQPVQRKSGRVVIEYESEWFDYDQVPDNGNVNLIIGEPGDGKTHGAALKHADDKVTAIAPLKTLTSAQADKFSQLGRPMESYEDVDDNERLQMLDRKSCTPNSEWRLGDKREGVLFRDEFKQEIRNLRSTELYPGNQGPQQLQRMKAGLNQYDTVYLADADTDELTAQIVEGLLVDRGVNVVINKRRRNRGPLTIVNSRARAIQKIEDLAREKRGPVHVSVYRERAAMADIVAPLRRKGFRVMVVSAHTYETDPEVRGFVKALQGDEDMSLYDYDVIVTTTAMKSGVSCMKEIRAVVLIADGYELTADDLHQMINRFRIREETYAYVMHNSDRKPNFEEDPEVITAQRIARAEQTNDALLRYDHTQGRLVCTDEQKEFERVIALLEADENKSRNNLRAHFLEKAQGSYSQIRWDMEEVPDSIKEAQKVAHRDFEEREKRAVVSETPISPEEYDHIISQARQERVAAPLNVSHQFMNWVVANACGEERATERTYDVFKSQSKRKRLSTYNDVVFVHREEILASDSRDADFALHTRKHRWAIAAKLRHLCKQLFGIYRPAPGIEISIEDMKRISGEWRESHLEDIYNIFNRRKDASQDPVNIVQWILRTFLGVSLKKGKRQENGRKIEFYSISVDDFHEWHQWAEQKRRKQILAANPDMRPGDVVVEALDDGSGVPTDISIVQEAPESAVERPGGVESPLLPESPEMPQETTQSQSLLSEEVTQDRPGLAAWLGE